MLLDSAGPMLSIFGGLNSAIGSYYATKSLESSLNFQKDMAAINGRIAETGAQQEFIKGQQQIGALTMRYGQLKSSQRAAMAANGIDLGEGNAAEIQASTDIMKEIDVNTLNANAVRSAYGLRMQGANYLADSLIKGASASGLSPVGSAATTLLGSAGQVASNWYQLGKSGALENLKGSVFDGYYPSIANQTWG